MWKLLVSEAWSYWWETKRSNKHRGQRFLFLWRHTPKKQCTTHTDSERETKWQALLFIWGPLFKPDFSSTLFSASFKIMLPSVSAPLLFFIYFFFSVKLTDSLPSEWGCRWEWSNKGDNGHVSLEQAGQTVLLASGRQWEKKGIVRERERETDRLETDISNVRGRITSLLLGCTQGSSRIQIPQFSNAVIMHSTQTLRACCFDWFFRHRYLDLSVVCRKTRVKKMTCFFSFSPKMWFGMT